MPEPVIREWSASEAEERLPALGAILVDAVAGGASVNFLDGFSQGEAETFWRGQLVGLAAGQRRLFVAERGGQALGTVVLTFAAQPNQPHRAEIGKMLVHRDARRAGIGRQLLAAAEDAARTAGRTLLVLDTEQASAGDLLYRRCGWTPIGTIPGYALTTRGVPAGATFFYKDITPRRAPAKVSADVAIRDATEADIPAVLAIYNAEVRDTTAIWMDTEATLENRLAILADRKARGYPFLVAEVRGAVAGYAAFGDFRPYEGYRGTVEHSVYVGADFRRLSIARLLLLALIERAQALGKHVMVGGIDATNEASIALHAALGFTETARMPEVGQKFGRWLDLVFLQKVLDGRI